MRRFYTRIFMNYEFFLFQYIIQLQHILEGEFIFNSKESYLSFQGVLLPEMFLLCSFQYIWYFDFSKFACAHAWRA